jgi:hypothetical protein
VHTAVKRVLVLLVALASCAVLAVTARNGQVPRPVDSPTSVSPGVPSDVVATGAAGKRVRSQGIATDVQAYAYGQRGYAPTADKSQTKLWWAKNTWWAVMVGARRGTQIYRLDEAQHAWVSTGVVVDARDRTYADAQWNGKELYVASRTSQGALLLNKFLPSPTRAGWRPVDGFPVTIASGGASSLSIATDSKDRLWAVYNQRRRIWHAVSAPGGATWLTPKPLTRAGAVQTDDTAAVAAFRNTIGVMWSDQVTGAFRWAQRRDTDPVRRLDEARSPVLSGLRVADGHVRLLPAPDGRLYAALKTSLGDVKTDAPSSPLLMVLRRELNGSWTRSVAATTTDQMTRPQISLSADGSRLYFVASSPQRGGALYLKVARTDKVVFAPGRGTLLLSWPGAVINNATVGRQPVNARTDLLVLASDARQGVYYYAKLPLS